MSKIWGDSLTYTLMYVLCFFFFLCRSAILKEASFLAENSFNKQQLKPALNNISVSLPWIEE